MAESPGECFGACWFFGACPVPMAIRARPTKYAEGKVGVAGCLAHRLVSSRFHDFACGRTGHGEPRTKRVPEAVPGDSGNFCLFDGGFEPGTIIESLLLTAGVDPRAILTWEDAIRPLYLRVKNGLDCGQCIGIEVDGADIAVFGLIQIDCTAVPIELASLDSVLFT